MKLLWSLCIIASAIAIGCRVTGHDWTAGAASFVAAVLFAAALAGGERT